MAGDCCRRLLLLDIEPVLAAPPIFRSRPCTAWQANPLSQLPPEFVMGVVKAAAFPLDAWFDDASMQSWLAMEFW